MRDGHLERHLERVLEDKLPANFHFKLSGRDGDLLELPLEVVVLLLVVAVVRYGRTCGE